MFFAEGAKGGKVTLDWLPDEELGDMVLIESPDDGRLLAVHESKLEEYSSLFGPTLDELEGRERYVSHFATCPHAEDFRRSS